MDIMIARWVKGHLFTVILAEDDPSQASLYRGAPRIGKARWDGEGFAGGAPDLLPDSDDSEDVYQVLTAALVERAALIRACDAADAANDTVALTKALLALVEFERQSERASAAVEEIDKRLARLTPEQRAMLARAVRGDS